MRINGRRRAGHPIPMDTGLRRYDHRLVVVVGARRLTTGIVTSSAWFRQMPARF